jgi:hypothetical protein
VVPFPQALYAALKLTSQPGDDSMRKASEAIGLADPDRLSGSVYCVMARSAAVIETVLQALGGSDLVVLSYVAENTCLAADL